MNEPRDPEIDETLGIETPVPEPSPYTPVIISTNSPGVLIHGTMCAECGALVRDTERHSQWHATESRSRYI